MHTTLEWLSHMTCALITSQYLWDCKFRGAKYSPISSVYILFSLYRTLEEFWIDAGHYVPQLAELVYDKNKDKTNMYINLKGFMVRI